MKKFNKLVYIFLSVMILLLAIFVYRYSWVKIESFSEPDYITEKTETYEIRPYSDVSPAIKKEIVRCFRDEWSDTGIDYSDEFIQKTWSYPSALYVMTVDDGETLIGTAGLDHIYVLPFVSHIYVKKQYRKKGYGEKLFNVVLKHGRALRYKSLNGWCKDNLVGHYEKMGCEKRKATTLLKPLLGFNLMTVSL